MLKWILFIAICLTWGSSFMLMKTGLESMSPYHVASIRILCAGLAMLPLLPKALRSIPAKSIGPVLLSGFLGSFFPAYLFCMAQTRIDSSLAGIMNALTPIFTLAIGAMFFKLEIAFMKWVGMIVGFSGMLVLLLGNASGISFDHLGYTLFVVLATIFYGLNVNMVNQFLKETSPIHVAAIAFSGLILPTLIVLGITGYFENPSWMDNLWSKGTAAAAFLGIMGTCVASILFYMLVKKAGPVFASTVTYIIPLVAIGWGLFSGENITWLQVGGMFIILLGVRLANR